MDEQNRKLCDTVSTMELPEDFDPRVDHFNNPDAKRYSGLGGELQASVDGGKVKLRVLRVPKRVRKEDLENVFTKLRCPFNVETKLNHRSHFLDAFVEFNSMGDAERAIREFSNKEPLKFELVVVVSQDKKLQKLEVVKEPPAIANDNQIDQPVQINSVEALEPLVPVLCTMWKSWNNIVELATGALGRMFAPSISLPNKSKVCDGRVCFIPPPAYFEKSNSGNYDNANNLNSNKTNSFIVCGKEADLPERYDHRPCVVCGLLTSSICIACKTVNYCCSECQAKDWKKHKLVCKKKDEGSETVKRNELAITKSDWTVSKSSLPGESKSINKSSHSTESVRRPKRRNCIMSRFMSELNDTLPEKIMSNENHQNSNGFIQNNVSSTSKSVCDSNGVKKVTPTSPFYIEGQVYEVFAQSVLDSREFFATRLDLKEHLETIHSELNREMSDSCQQLENVAVRSKCAVKYGGLWYRALVRKLDPLTVRCIDFGFDKTCKPADLKELPAKFKTALLTVLVRLTSDASVAKIRSSFKLHFIRKDGNHWLVEFANENGDVTIRCIYASLQLKM
ncbi:uncharacterized protein LOC111050912 [Nilaparvata lugens]|uniref:uncharacterized protein LOC111050912 n=1 Tax=Nilaparvata lugens TaxID=108931 RepID=UPI00193DADBD|nr:uncharacterized protein LOC111050912 [Nilaparvata lugens]